MSKDDDFFVEMDLEQYKREVLGKLKIKQVKVAKRGSRSSYKDNDYDFQIRLLFQSAGMPEPECEHRFHPVRRWKFDYAWVALKFAVELHGGVWSSGKDKRGGRHTRGQGFINDRIKMNEALILGWRVLEITTDMLNDGRAGDMIERAYKSITGA